MPQQCKNDFAYALSCFININGNPDRSLAQKLDCILDAGVNHFQVDIPLEWPLESLIAETKKRGLRCMVVNDYMQNLNEFDQNLKLAVSLGAKYYNHHFPKSFNTDLEGAVSMAKQLKERCAKENIQYLIELHRGTYTHNLERTYAFTKAYPEVAYLADMSHYIIQGYSYKELEGLYANVQAIHLRVANSECSQPEIFPEKTKGIQDFEKYYKDLLKLGFNGPVISEMIPFYLQYPPYDLHENNKKIIALAKEWSGL